MPYAAPLLDDEEKKKQQDGSGGVNVSGQSASFDSNVPGSEASGGSGAQKSSGQYTNIQSYLDANKEQGDQMGQKITSDVSSKADDATNKINSFQSTAPKVDAYDPNAVLGNVTGASDADKANYKTMKQTGGYTGPQSIDQAQGYAETNKAATDASQAVKNAGTETGQQQLLKQNYGRPQYSAGENKLDQVLLQNSAGSKAGLENLSQKYSGLDQMLSGANTQVGDAINSANATALANRQAFNPAETKARNDLINPIQQRADNAFANNKDFSTRVKNDASDETLSDETLQALGLSAGQNIYDLNLGNYVTPNETQVGINNVATDDERGRYAALQQLLDDPTMSQITADGKQINPVNFNKDQFDRDYAGRDAEVNQAMKNFGVNVDPYSIYGTGAAGVANPFNSAKLGYDQYKSIAAPADAFFSKYGSNYSYNPANYADYTNLRDAMTNAAISGGVANSHATGDAARDAFIEGLSRTRDQYNNVNKQYGIGRQIKKG